MRVLHSCPPLDPSWGGPFWSVRGLAQTLESVGCETSVRMPFAAAAMEHSPSWAPATMNCEGSVRLRALGWSPEFAALVLRSSADILHTHGLWLHPSWVARSWKSRLGRPHVASIRGMLEPWALRHRRWKKWPTWHLLEKSNLRSASLLHATSEMELRSIRRAGLRNAVAVIPNGVSVPDLSSLRVPKSERPRAVALGRIHPVKGLDRLLEAWSEIRPRSWELVIAGPDEGGHLLELDSSRARLHLEDSVTFCGPVRGEAKRELLASADLLVAPSHSENFGIAIAEGLAHGLPVLTTQGTPWAILEAAEAGWWVENSVEAISEGLALATSKSRTDLHEMGSRGRDLMEAQFSWRTVGDRFRDSYRWVLEGGLAPPWIVPVDSEPQDPDSGRTRK